MPEKDFAIGTVGIPSVGSKPTKPFYLVVLSTSGKKVEHFISIDKPDLLQGFIQAKGFYSDLSEDELSEGIADVVTSTPKEHYLDILLPAHRVQSIRNLSFNAVKPTSIAR
jgi:hypothetical protein